MEITDQPTFSSQDTDKSWSDSQNESFTVVDTDCDSQSAEDLLEKGRELLRTLHFDEAVKCFEKAITIEPDFATAYNNKGNAMYRLQDYQSALSWYDKAIVLEPSFTSAHNNRGCTLFKLECYDNAIAAYDKAISCDSNFAPAYKNKGHALKQLGRLKETISCLDKAIELKHNVELSLSDKGNVLSQLGRYRDAMQCYDLASELDEFGPSYAGKGNTFYRMKKYSNAFDFYEKALVHYNKQGTEHYEEALSLLVDGKQDLAIQALEKAFGKYKRMSSVLSGRNESEQNSQCSPKKRKTRNRNLCSAKRQRLTNAVCAVTGIDKELEELCLGEDDERIMIRRDLIELYDDYQWCIHPGSFSVVLGVHMKNKLEYSTMEGSPVIGVESMSKEYMARRLREFLVKEFDRKL
jgi:tetratricopeptide (TPR) repeat protein